MVNRPNLRKNNLLNEIMEVAWLFPVLIFTEFKVKLIETLKKLCVDKTALLTKYQVAKTAKKFCMACWRVPAIRWRHICLQGRTAFLPFLFPRRVFWPSFKLFQQDSISWVCTPSDLVHEVESVDNYLMCFYIVYPSVVYLWEAQSSGCTSVPERLPHLEMMRWRVAISRLSTTGK